jgi:uncharacterized OB-fold protein
VTQVADKPAPKPTPESKPFWDGANSGQLRIQKCVTTGKHFFPPRRYSPYTVGGETEWVEASGRATLYSYVINHRAAPGFENDGPYAIAVVELEEGPRMMANIVGIEIEPEKLVLDMPLQVQFEARGEQQVPVFGPAAGSAK